MKGACVSVCVPWRPDPLNVCMFFFYDDETDRLNACEM